MTTHRVFPLIIGRRIHAALGPMPRTLCGREIAGRNESAGLTAKQAYRQTDCRACRRSFHESIKGAR